MRYKLLALYGSLVTLAACTSYAVLKLSLQSPEALPLTQCQSDEVYPDLTDCSKFYICSPDGPELFQCPLGFHFNPTKLVCDWTIEDGCILNDDASSTIISFEETYTDGITTGTSEVSVVELDNGYIISQNLDTKSPSFEPPPKITGYIDKISFNITSNNEETTHSNNTYTNTAKFSQFPIVNPEVTLTVINEPNANDTNSNPILTSVNNFIVNDQEILTKVSSEVNFNSEFTTINPNDSQSPVLTTELDIISNYTTKIGRNDLTKRIYNIYATEVTKNYTHENEESSTNLINSAGSNLFKNNKIIKTDALSESANELYNENRNISSNTTPSNNDTITYGNIIQNTEHIDKTHFSSDIPIFEQHDHDDYINTSSKNDDNIKLEDKNIHVPAGSIKVVAHKNSSLDNIYIPYLRYKGNMTSTEGNFKSDIESETNPNQRVSEEISTVTATETTSNAHFYELRESTISSFIEEDSEIVPTESGHNTHSEIHLISTAGKFTDTKSSQSVNPFDKNNGRFVSSENPTNDLYLPNSKSDSATATYSGNKDSKIFSRYNVDQEIITVGSNNINDVENDAVAEQVIDSSTNSNENIPVSSYVFDKNELHKFAIDNVIDNTTTIDFWKEANSVFLSLTSTDEKDEERIITTTTNIHVNISASIYEEDFTSEYLKNNNISTHIDSNNDTEHYVVSSKRIDEKPIPYISNRGDMYSEIEKYSGYGYTPLVSYSEFVDGTNLNYKHDDDINEITNENFLSFTDSPDTITGNTLENNNFYDNVHDRLSSSTKLLDEQEGFNNELVNNQTNTNRMYSDEMDNTTTKHLKNVYNATISFEQTIQTNTWTTNLHDNAKDIKHKYIDNNTSLEIEYDKEMASAVSDRKTDHDITTKMVNVNNNKNDTSSFSYESNNQNDDGVILSYAPVTQPLHTTQQIVPNISATNNHASIKNNSNLEKINSPSTLLEQGEKPEDNLTSENNLHIVENMSKMKPNEINHFSSDIKFETYFSSTVQENFSISSEHVSSPSDVSHDYSGIIVSSYMNNNKSIIESENEKYISDISIDTTKNTSPIDIQFNTAKSVEEVTDNNLENINILQNKDETSSEDYIITNDTRSADNVIFSTTTSSLQEDNARYDKSVLTTSEYIDSVELYTEESSKRMESQLISSKSSSNEGSGINNYHPYSDKDEIELSTETVPILEYNSNLLHENEDSNTENNIFSNNNDAASVIADDNSKYLANEDGIILSRVNFSKTGERKFSKHTEGISSNIENIKSSIKVSNSVMTNKEKFTTAQLPVNLDAHAKYSEDLARVVTSSPESVSEDLVNDVSTDYKQENNQYSEIEDNENIIYNYINDNNAPVASTKEHITYISSGITERNAIYNVDSNTIESPNTTNTDTSSSKEYITYISSGITERNVIYNVDSNTIESPNTTNTDASSENTEISSNTDDLSAATGAKIYIIDNVRSSTENPVLMNNFGGEATMDSVIFIKNNISPTNITHNFHLTKSSQLPQDIEGHPIYRDVNYSPFDKSNLLDDINTEKIQLANVPNDNLNNRDVSKFLTDRSTDSVNLIPAINDLNSTNDQTTDTSSDSFSDNINRDNMNKYVSFSTKKYIDNEISKSVGQVNEEYSVNHENMTTETVLIIGEVFNNGTENYLHNELYQKENSAKYMHSSRNDSIISEHTQKVIAGGSKSTNDIEKEETILVATSPDGNKIKNDLSTDLAQGLKDIIIFSSTSKTNMNEPLASLDAAYIVNLNISNEQITNVTVNNNDNRLSQRRPHAVVTPLTNVKINTTNLLKRFTKTSQPKPFKASNISFSGKDKITTGNHIEQPEYINKATERSSISIPNISKQKIYQDKETVSYIFNKSSIHIVVNSSVSHLIQHQIYSNTTKYTTSYSKDKVNSKRMKIMQIISKLSNNPIMKNKSNSRKKNSTNGNISEKDINGINDNVGDKRQENTDKNGNTAYKKKWVKIKEDNTEKYNTNESDVNKHTNKQHNINENNTNDDNMNEESIKDNTRQENNAIEDESKTDNAVKARRGKHNRKEISMKQDTTNVRRNTVEDIVTLEKNKRNNKNRNTVKVFKNKYNITESNKKAKNFKKDHMKGYTDRDNTYEKSTKKNNNSEENVIENKSNNNDPLEYNTKEDGINEYYTEEDSTEEDSTEEDSTEEDSTYEDSTEEDNSEDRPKANNPFENHSKDDRSKENTKEDSLEEDNNQESGENRYTKNGKDHIVNDISKETVEDVSKENTIEDNVSQGDSDSNIMDLSAIEDLINKTNDGLNKEKYYIRRLLEAANVTATNNIDNYMRPLNNRNNRKNKNKYGKMNKNKKQYQEEKIAERNRQHKYQRESKQDVEKNLSRNQNKSNNRNRKWRTLTDREENKEVNRKQKGKHAFILNIKKVIFEKSLKDINWEL